MASSTEPKPPVRLGEFLGAIPSYGHFCISNISLHSHDSMTIFFNAVMRCLVLCVIISMVYLFLMSLDVFFCHYGQVEAGFVRICNLQPSWWVVNSRGDLPSWISSDIWGPADFTHWDQMHLGISPCLFAISSNCWWKKSGEKPAEMFLNQE